MFDQFRKRKKIGSPVMGKSIPLKEVPDPTFSEELVGKGAAVIPSEGKIYAPCDGKVTVLFETLHAVCIQTDYDAEILIHIGLDTVLMKGDGFKAHVKVDDMVKKGDLLIEVDLEKVKNAGHSIVTPIVVCNPTVFKDVQSSAGSDKKPGDDLITVTLK